MISILKRVSTLLVIMLLFGCKTNTVKTQKKLQLKFLDEFVLPEDVMVDGSLVGGLSGIDYHKGIFYLVCDDSKNPRYYKATIEIEDDAIFDIIIENVVRIKDTTKYLDLEAIRYNPKTNEVLLTSEGNINQHINPSFFSIDTLGKIETKYRIPNSFNFNSNQKPRHNGTLESLSNCFDGEGYWIAMELPLIADGPQPQLTKTKSPARITYIDSKVQDATKQFAYLLEPIAKQSQTGFSVNGLTELLEHKKESFFVIERSFSSGLGNQGNSIKIFNVNAAKATNILNLDSLKEHDFVPATKELLLDFEQLRNKLTNSSIDNIEGITFGPTLSNGNKSLILVSDNNFNQFGEQLNQFILLEIID